MSSSSKGLFRSSSDPRTANGSSTLKLNKKEEEETVLFNPIFRPRAKFIELLLGTDWEVVYALCQVVVVPEEGRTVAEALIDFFAAEGRLEPLLQWAVVKELQLPSTTSSTLFRGSSFVTKLMPVLYLKMGRTFLKHVAGSLLKDVTTFCGSFELDKAKAEKGANIKENYKTIVAITHEFLQHIVASVNMCPMLFRRTFAFICQEVAKRFPESEKTIMGVFFFSRYLIPAILSPDQWGLTNEPLSLEAQRVIIHVSKILQNLSIGIEFDEKKDENMEQFNKFIRDHTASIQKFFAVLTAEEEIKSPKVKILYSVSSEEQQQCINVLTDAMKENMQKIHALLVNSKTKKKFIKLVEADLFSPSSASPDTSIFNTLRRKDRESLRLRPEERTSIDSMLKLEESKSRKYERKIEKLTLTVTEQKKKIEDLETTTQSLQEQIKQLQASVELMQQLLPVVKKTSSSGKSS